MPVELITFLIIILGVVVIMILERRFPYTMRQPVFREGFWVDLVWYTLFQSFFLKMLIFDFIIKPIDAGYGFSQHRWIGHWPLLAQVIFFLVTHDFYIYWFHRWQHHSKILWRTHEAHHSVKQVDWLAGSRSHVLEIIINQTIEFAPIILLGADPVVVPIKACMDAVWGMFIHSNIDVRLGWLLYVINSPELHQWHHADDKKVFYANYATKLAIWDWLFNTAYLPAHKPAKFGLFYKFPKDYFLQHVFSFIRFDEEKLRQNPRWCWYLDLRKNFLRNNFSGIQDRLRPEKPTITQV